MSRRGFSLLRRTDRGAVAIEAALTMALIAGSVLVAVPELVHQTRAASLTTRATALTVDLLGAQNRVLTSADFATAEDMAHWAIQPLDPDLLAFRAQSFVRDRAGAVTEEWNRTSGSACTPRTASAADAEALISVDDRSMIAVSSCYRVPSLTGFIPDHTIGSQFWQTARRGRVTTQ